jgi:protein-S-isoprenylcysteine O-methyltransferase Ste14
VVDEHPDTPGVIAPPPLIYGAGLLLGWVIEQLRPWPLLPPAWTIPVAAVCLLAGLVAFAALRAFVRADTSPNPWRPSTHLVTGGPYRFTRNPMYLGLTLLYLGATAWLNTLWPLLLLPIVLLVMQRGVIAREEEYLERRFGQEYTDYRARVRRWL